MERRRRIGKYPSHRWMERERQVEGRRADRRSLAYPTTPRPASSPHDLLPLVPRHRILQRVLILLQSPPRLLATPPAPGCNTHPHTLTPPTHPLLLYIVTALMKINIMINGIPIKEKHNKILRRQVWGCWGGQEGADQSARHTSVQAISGPSTGVSRLPEPRPNATQQIGPPQWPCLLVTCSVFLSRRVWPAATRRPCLVCCGSARTEHSPGRRRQP